MASKDFENNARNLSLEEPAAKNNPILSFQNPQFPRPLAEDERLRMTAKTHRE